MEKATRHSLITWPRLLGVLLLVIVIALSGCGGSQTEGDDGASEGSGGEEAEQDGGEPQSGGTVSIPIVGDPTFNQWHPQVYAESNLVNRALFSGLTKPGEDLAPSPDLAKDWEVSEDGLAWIFHLREDVTWHDGEPFTAEDVAYTFNEIALVEELGANNYSTFQPINEVEVIDSSTVVFHLDSPFAALPAYLSFNAEILPKHKFEGVDPWNLNSFNKENPVGTGPFKLDKYTSGQGVELVPNPNYYEGEPYLDRLVFKVLADANTHIAQALSNELSIFALEDASSVERVENADNLRIHPQEATRFFWIALNQENDLFTDVKVRQAFLHAIDRQSIIDTVLKGYASIADAAISPSLKQYYTDDVTRYEYDPEKAKELLAEVGWEDTDGDGILDKDGQPFAFDFDIGQQGDLEPIAQMVQQYLNDIGLDVQLNVMEWNAMIEKNIVQRDYDMALNWWLYPGDPDVLPYFHSSNAGTGRNIPGYKDEKLDELLELGQKSTDLEERKEVYIELQQYMSETLPYLFLWYPQEIQVRNEKLRGVPEMRFGDTLHYVHEWWIEQ